MKTQNLVGKYHKKIVVETNEGYMKISVPVYSVEELFNIEWADELRLKTKDLPFMEGIELDLKNHKATVILFTNDNVIKSVELKNPYSLAGLDPLEMIFYEDMLEQELYEFFSEIYPYGMPIAFDYMNLWHYIVLTMFQGYRQGFYFDLLDMVQKEYNIMFHNSVYNQYCKNIFT